MDYSKLSLTDEVAGALKSKLTDVEVKLLSDTFSLTSPSFHKAYEIISLDEFEERLEEYLMDNEISRALRKLREV